MTNFMTKPTASPCAPHPKQWKKPFLSLTAKDSVFSLWNGQACVLRARPPLQRDLAADDIGQTEARTQFVEEARGEGHGAM